jgi:uncharacterized protein HemX
MNQTQAQNQQLTSANTTAHTYEAVAPVFVIIAVALVGFSIYQMRNKSKTKNVREEKETSTS